MNLDAEIQPRREAVHGPKDLNTTWRTCTPKQQTKACLQSTFGSFESDLIIVKPRKSEQREEWSLAVYAHCMTRHFHHVFLTALG